MAKIERFQPHHNVNHTVVTHGDTLYIQGLASQDPSLDMKGQMQDILRRLDGILTSVGSDKTKVLSALLYVKDLSLRPQFNEAWREYFATEDMPARASIGIADLGPGLLVEIVVVAAR